MSDSEPRAVASTATKASTAKKAPAKKAPAKKTPAKKTSTAKKVPAKKVPAGMQVSAGAESDGARTTPHRRSSRKSRSKVKAVKVKAVLGAPTSKYFKKARTKAQGVLNNPEKMRTIAEEASASSAHRSGPFMMVIEDFRALIRLVVAYTRGYYRDTPADELALIVAGLIYVVSPVDLIPDVLPGGFVDDAVVIGWILKVVHDELDSFRDWEEGRTPR